MEDVIETILGDEIVDETDKVADLQEYAIQQGKTMSDNVYFFKKYNSTFFISKSFNIS